MSQTTTLRNDQTACSPRRLRGPLAAALVVILAAMITAWLPGLFGPPQVLLVEAYEGTHSAKTFDHSLFDGVLKKHVDRDGWVDYDALRSDPAALDRYIAALATAPFDDLGRDEKLALLINAYNAFTLRLILDHFPLKSIQDIPENKRWDERRWNVAGNVWSLNDIEHEQIRAKFKEPRIHFSLVCASVGCPPLRPKVYSAGRLEQQLDEQAKHVHKNERWFRYDESGSVVHLTQLYDWYGNDFEQVAGSVLTFAARYSPPLQAALRAGSKPRIKWLDYDWSLNGQQNQRNSDANDSSVP